MIEPHKNDDILPQITVISEGSSLASASASHKEHEPPPPDPAEVQTLYEQAEHRNPSLWRICYPRIYSNPPKCGQYYPAKSCAWKMATIALSLKFGPSEATNLYEFFAASHLARFGVPMFWLSDEIARAIRQTIPPPGDINWSDLRIPFDSGVFMLPKGSLTHPIDGDVHFVAYARLQAGKEFISPLCGKPYFVENGVMIFLANAGPHFFQWILPLDGKPALSLMELDDMLMSAGQDYGGGHPLSEQARRARRLSDPDKHLGTGVAHYILGTILLMNARPELVTNSTMQKRVTKKGVIPKEFWTPNIIGEHYKVRREVVDHGGNHASPRLHWVRGSYRQQPYGAGSELRKQIWVEPFMRGLMPQ